MGIAQDLAEKWESLLQWSDEKGLPFRSISDSLEEKGIPAMPFFIFLLLLLVGGGLYLAFGKTTIGVGVPTDMTIYVTLKDSTGAAIPDAILTLTQSDDLPNIQGTTNSDGDATFENVKIGTHISVSAATKDGDALSLENPDFNVASGIRTYELNVEVPVMVKSYSLHVEVKGVDDPTGLRISLLDSDGFPIGAPQSDSTSATFAGLSANTPYNVRVKAGGYNSQDKAITITENDESIVITLVKMDAVINGKLRVLAKDEGSLKLLKDVSIDITDATTDTVYATNLKTGENGLTSALDIPIGRKVRILANLKDYDPLSQDSEISATTDVTMLLKLIPLEERKAIKLKVIDEAGNPITNPVVRFYDSNKIKKFEANPSDGIALFNNILGNEQYLATIVKPGYIPTKKDGLQKGSTYEIKMAAASSANTAKVKVQVENQNEEAVGQASTSLYYEDGYPLGLQEKIAGPDGIATYDELPLEKIYSKASFNGRVGSSGLYELTSVGTGEEEGINLLKIILKPAKGRVSVLVKDHFTNTFVENAKVEFSISSQEFSPAAFCTTKNGRCKVEQLQEGYYVARIIGDGYDPFLSSEFEVKPNTDNKVNFDIVSSDIAEKTKVIFNGVFNLNGESVTTLSPSTTYVAKFILNRPRVKISKAELQVRLGNAGIPLSNEPAEIVGYDASGALISKGETYEAPEGFTNVVEESSPTPSPTSQVVASASPIATLNLADAISSDAFKYVHFDFTPFEGSKEAMVQFRTRAIETGKVDIQYRSAFFTQNEVLRDPIDQNAPRVSFEANMKSELFPISFEGKCEDEICLLAYFEGSAGNSQDNYEAQISETFKLNFKLISEKGTTVELSAPLGDQTIALTEGTSGGSKAAVKQTEDRQILAITTPEKDAEGTFSMQARRLANSIDLQLKIQSGDNSISKAFSVRIVGEKPDLKVSYNVISEKAGGKSLKALRDNKVTFTITDSLDLPLKNVFVTLGNGVDALGGAILEAQSQEARDGSITYIFESINPPSVGIANYKIIADGFKQKKGTIPVMATTLFTFDNKPLSLSLNSEESQTEEFSVQNLLQNELKMTYSITGTDSQYADIEIESSDQKIKGEEKLSNNLIASISEYIPKIAAKPGTLKEKVTGKIKIIGKLGTTTQEEEIPYTLSVEIKQDDLNPLWEISSEKIGFALQPPKTADAAQTIEITNNAPIPILINHQVTLKSASNSGSGNGQTLSAASDTRVTIEPLSFTIEPGATTEFTITSKFTGNDDACRFEDAQAEGKIDFYASNGGVISKKTASLSVSIGTSENCILKDGLRIALPVSLSAQLPADTKTKYNSDGSLLIELPSKERFVFDSGAQLTSNANQYASFQDSTVFPAVSASGGKFIVIPAGVFIEAPKAYVRQSSLLQAVSLSASTGTQTTDSLASDSYTLTLPFASFLDFGSTAQFAQIGDNKVASIDDYDVYFPAKTKLVPGKGAKERRAYLAQNTPITIQVTPYVNTKDSKEVYFPVDATLVITDQVRIRTDEFTGSQALLFPSGLAITLPADSRTSTDATAAGSSGDLFNEQRKIIIPSGSVIRIPSPYAAEGLQSDLQVKLPFKMQFKVPIRNDRISLNLDAGGIEAKSISTEIYEMVFSPGTTRLGLELLDGTQMVETLANAPIYLRPTDFGVVGPKRRLPVGITLYLPSTVTTKNKGGYSQVEFENGNRILVQNAQIVKKEFETAELTIPANTEITFSENSPSLSGRMVIEEKSVFGTTRYTVRIPTKITYHFPLANSIFTPPNKIENVPEGYSAEFMQRVFMKNDNNFNNVELTPIESMAGVTFSGVDPDLPGLDFEFLFSFPITAQLPQDQFQQPTLEPYKQRVGEIYHSFRYTTGGEMKLSDSGSGDEFTFIASRLLVRNYDFYSADFQSDPKTFVIPTTTRIIPKIMPDDNKKYMLNAIFGREVQFTLPTVVDLVDDKTKFVDLKGCRRIEVAVGDRKYSLPMIKAILFPKDARVLPSTTVGTEEALQQILVDKNQQLTFELCPGKAGKDTAGSVQDLTRALVAFETDKDGAKRDVTDKIIDVEFNNAQTTKTIDTYVCVQNWAWSELRVDFRLSDNPLAKQKTLAYKEEGWRGDGVKNSISTDLDGAIKSISRPESWEQDPFLRLLPKEPAAQSCKYQAFKLEIGVPFDYLDQDGCIKKEYRGIITDPTKTFITLYGRLGNQDVPAQKIGIRINLKDEGSCEGDITKKFREMLGGFFVNYQEGLTNARDGKSPMKLYFKGPGANHERTLAMLNNLDEEVAITYAGGALDKGIIKFKDGKGITRLAPGEGAVVTFLAGIPGADELEITGSGKVVKTTHSIRAEVYALDPKMASIYSSSPLGDPAPQEALMPETDAAKDGQGAATVSKRKEIVFAGDAPKSANSEMDILNTINLASDKSNSINFATTPTAGAPASQPNAPIVPEDNSPTSTAADTFGSKLPKEVMDCQTNFCNSDQVETAFVGFATEFKKMINTIGTPIDKTPFVTQVNRFCDRIKNKDYIKSIVIQASNSKGLLTADRANQLLVTGDSDTNVAGVFQAEKRKAGSSLKINSNGAVISECGIYILKARLNICTTRPTREEDWLKNSEIEFSLIKSSAVCGETIANTALLLGDRKSTEPYVGREQNNGIGIAKEDQTTGAGGIIGAIEAVPGFGRLTIGPYKEASNSKDKQNIGTIYEALYAKPRTELLSVAEPYNEAVYCNKYAATTLGIMTVPVITAIGTSIMFNLGTAFTVGGAPLAGKGLVLGLKAGYGVSTTLSLCLVSALQSGARTASDSTYSQCEVDNQCIAGGIGGAMETLITAIPDGGVGASIIKSFIQKTIAESISNIAVTGVIDGATIGINALTNEDNPAYTPTPVMYGSQKVIKWFGTKAYLIDYFAKKGMKLTEASKLANEIFLTNKPAGGKYLAAKILGIDTKTVADLDLTKYLKEVKDAEFKSASKLETQQNLWKKQIEDGLPDNKLLQALRAANIEEYKSIVGDLETKRNLVLDWDSKIAALKQSNGIATVVRTPGDYWANPDLLDLPVVDQKALSELNAKRLTAIQEWAVANEQLSEKARKSLTTSLGTVSKAELIDNSKKVLLFNDPPTITRLKGLGLSDKEIADFIGEEARFQNSLKQKFKKLRGGEFANVEKYKAARNILQLVVPFLFHVDVRPVQAALDYRYPHHVVSFSTTEGKPSITQICARSFEDEETCVNTLDTATICDPENSNMCILLVKGKKFTTEDGYTLIAGVNKGLDAEKAMKSLFISTEKPLSSTDLDPSKAKINFYSSMSQLPGNPQVEAVYPGTPATQAKETYDRLRTSLSESGYGPGTVTDEFLDGIREQVESDPSVALDKMLKAAKFK